jgi:hypothetical protein
VERTVKKALLKVLRPGRSLRALSGSSRLSALLRSGIAIASLLAAGPAWAGASTLLVAKARGAAFSKRFPASLMQASVKAALAANSSD